MRFIFLQAFTQLIGYDIFLLWHDFAALHARLEHLPVSSRRPEAGEIERICHAVAYACIWYPKHTLCLQRSAVATTLLRQYGIPARLVIGAQRLPLKAHAWVEVEGRVVNDKAEVQSEYRVMEQC